MADFIEKRKINFIVFFLLVFMIIFFLTNIYFPLFIFNLILLFLILKKAKFSLFSLKTIICFYVLVPVFFQQYIGKSYGILEYSIVSNNMKLETAWINLIIFLYLLVNYIFVHKTKILDYEKRIYSKISNITIACPLLFSLLAIFFIIVYYPPTFLSNGDRFYHLLPGNFWNCLSSIFLIFLLPVIKKQKKYILPWLFVIGWCFLRNERVDALGLFILLLVYLRKNKMLSKKIFIIILVLSLIGLSVMGFTRMDIGFNSFKDFILKIVVQSTSSDIAYLLNISIRYTKDFGYLLGKTYLNYFYELLPLGTSTYDASYILSITYGHPGGIHLLAEPFMNFGIIGVLLYSIIECFFMYWVLKKKNKVICIYYCYFVVASFRYCWYGLRYLETGMIYLIPLVYILNKILLSFKYEKNMLLKNVHDN